MTMKSDGRLDGWKSGNGMGYYFSKEGQEAQQSELRRGYMRGQTEFDLLENLDFVHELDAEDMIPDDVISLPEEKGFIMGWTGRAYDSLNKLSKTPIGNVTKPNPHLPLA